MELEIGLAFLCERLDIVVCPSIFAERCDIAAAAKDFDICHTSGLIKRSKTTNQDCDYQNLSAASPTN